MRNVQRSITQKKRQLTTLATGLFAVRAPPPPAQPRGQRAPTPVPAQGGAAPYEEFVPSPDAAEPSPAKRARRPPLAPSPSPLKPPRSRASAARASAETPAAAAPAAKPATRAAVKSEVAADAPAAKGGVGPLRSVAAMIREVRDEAKETAREVKEIDWGAEVKSELSGARKTLSAALATGARAVDAEADAILSRIDQGVDVVGSSFASFSRRVRDGAKSIAGAKSSADAPSFEENFSPTPALAAPSAATLVPDAVVGAVGAVGALVGAVDEAVDEAGAVVEDAVVGAAMAVGGAAAAAANVVDGGLDAVEEAIVGAARAMGGAAGAVAAGVADGAAGAVDGAVAGAQEALGGAADDLEDALEEGMGAVEGAVEGAAQAVESAVGGAAQAVADGVSAVGGAADAVETRIDAGLEAVQGRFEGGLLLVQSGLEGTMSSWWSPAASALGGGLRAVEGTMSTVMGGADEIELECDELRGEDVLDMWPLSTQTSIASPDAPGGDEVAHAGSA